MIQEQIDLNFQNDKKLALWKLSSSNCQADKNVFLTHGTFSDKKVCLGIGEYLVGKGYNCWVLEWRNHVYRLKITLQLKNRITIALQANSLSQNSFTV